MGALRRSQLFLKHDAGLLAQVHLSEVVFRQETKRGQINLLDREVWSIFTQTKRFKDLPHSRIALWFS